MKAAAEEIGLRLLTPERAHERSPATSRRVVLTSASSSRSDAFFLNTLFTTGFRSGS